MSSYTENLSSAIAELAKTDALPTPDHVELSMQDPEVISAMQQYCEHSGKPCGKADADQTRSLIAIHGKDTAIKVLKTQQKQVSLEWIWLNSNGLANLAQDQPREFFVYICQKLLINQTKNNELLRFEETVKAFARVQFFDEDLLTNINELIRRLLGMACRTNVEPLLRKFNCRTLIGITSTFNNLTTFQADLQNAISHILQQRKKRKMQEEGISVYRQMGMIKALSELELSIGHEFNDFDIMDGKSDEYVEVLSTGKVKTEQIKKTAKELAKKDRQPKFANKTVVKTGIAQLKLGGN